LPSLVHFTPCQGGAIGTLLRTEIQIARSIETVFDFFADAANLESITPPWLGFRIETPKPIEIAAGSLIDYRLKLHRIPIRWRTEISDWEPPVRFVDRQVRGPYQLWEHTHEFTQCSGGTLVRDTVRFRVPGGWPIRTLMVQPELIRIFRYRHDRLAEIFGEVPARSRLLQHQDSAS
jgi:ligand-binding SRPBCC domain-containing protein